MAERKIFAGPRIRRIRNSLGLTQADMAGALEISPSYLNLIERNQRPLTVQVLLKLQAAFDISAAELQLDEEGEGLDALKTVFADPLLSDEVPSPSELEEVAEAAPNVVRGVARLYEAYMEGAGRLTELSQLLAEGGELRAEMTARLPFDRVAAYFEEAGPWIGELEEAASALTDELTPRDDPFAALKAHLRERHGIDLRILPTGALPDERARFDRHSMRFFISEAVPLIDRAYLVALQVAQSGHGQMIARLANEAGLKDGESQRLLRAGFARRLADAILVPAPRLAGAARELRFDIAALCHRFQTRGARIMSRLAILGGRPDAGFEAALLVLDAAGSPILRVRGAGFPFARFGAPCGRLPVFDRRTESGVLAARLVFPDGATFLALAAREAEALAETSLPPPLRISLLAFPERFASETSYDFVRAAPPRPVGVTCRLCEREGCAHRAQPPATRPAGLADYRIAKSDREIP
ncbi:short-chain fatty acyl-CoA regulator family protein [Afifella sp. IM 167]|uniref:short-chain fatty acyl-CoA regulator family protein n=1 Tax=Afifella sp. IM 167 TaxID=2033586 RepID=UPI001CCEEBA5|nr:short-chain fatty acyl-CoA regulator family protein [Afifella sp. IM 167]MBZ8135083.1 Cro/Cl family transcriptional regulator [Afifella sp. IM 167]